MKSVKTARGKIIDMGALRARHEDTRAISNVPINAKGDIIDSRGKVVVPREEISKEYYKDTVTGVEEKVSIKQEAEEEKETVIEEPVKSKATPKKETAPPKEEQVYEINRRQRTRDDGSSYWEIEFSDGSMEIEEE